MNLFKSPYEFSFIKIDILVTSVNYGLIERDIINLERFDKSKS